MKSFIAINLNDFHSSEKKWQKGTETSVEVMMIGAKSLERAKDTARIDNNHAWYVFPFNNTNNIAYRELKGGDNGS